MFENNAKLSSKIDSVIKRHRGLADDIQAVLMGIAFQVMEHKNSDQLTRLVYGLSDMKEGEGNLSLKPTAKAVGRYMVAMLPIKWDKETQRFKAEAKKHEDFDWEAAYNAMCETRWDSFETKPANDEFNPEKEWGKVVSIVKKIHKDAPEDSEYRAKADTVIRQFGIAL